MAAYGLSTSKASFAKKNFQRRALFLSSQPLWTIWVFDTQPLAQPRALGRSRFSKYEACPWPRDSSGRPRVVKSMMMVDVSIMIRQPAIIIEHVPMLDRAERLLEMRGAVAPNQQ